MKKLFSSSLSYIRLYLRAAKIVWQASHKLSILWILMSSLATFAIPLQMWISKYMIDQLTDAIVYEKQATRWQVLLLPFLLYIWIWISMRILVSASIDFRGVLSERVDYYVQQQILRKAASLDVAFFENSKYFDQLHIAQSEAWRLDVVILQLIEIVSQVILLLSLLILLGNIFIALPILLLLFVIPKVISHSHFTRKKTGIAFDYTSKRRVINYIVELLSNRENVKEVRLFQIQNYLLGRFLSIRKEYLRKLFEVTTLQGRANIFSELLSLVGIACIWVYAGLGALARWLSLGDIALIFQAVEQSRAAINQVALSCGYLVENTMYLNALFGFLDLEPIEVEGGLTRPKEYKAEQTEKCNLDVPGTIEFHQVCFTYPGTKRSVLRDVSFKIRQGERIALVGENGAGKTTLVKLLSRLYDPNQGSITINGKDLREFDPQQYYRQVGVIFQDFVHYDLTVKENIGFGNIDAIQDMSRIQKAAEMGGAVELVEHLPQGYETVLGKQFEGGVDLSGGQWQKMALARAFMRDAPLLILDEPTAALDAKAENEVYLHFAELTQGKTTIFVTHRLSSTQLVDRILVLKDGVLVEEGSHEELLRLSGEYAYLFNLQAQRYQTGQDYR